MARSFIIRVTIPENSYSNWRKKQGGRQVTSDGGSLT
jgi:hypothetical protein